MSSELYNRMKASFAAYSSGIEKAMMPQRGFLVGDNVTLADICFVTELCLFHNERARSSVLETAGFSPLLDSFVGTYPRSAAHFHGLLAHPAVSLISPGTWKRSKVIVLVAMLKDDWRQGQVDYVVVEAKE
jgi:hypothetical protein